MIAVFRRELKTFFSRFSSYLFFALFVLVTSLLITLFNFFYTYSNFEYVLSYLTVIFSLLVPILTVRAFFEEKERGAYRFLKMLPISRKDIVLGKFLFLLFVLAITTALLALCPLFIGMYAKVNYLSAYCAIAAFFMFSISLISIELFIASIFKKGVFIWIVSYALPIIFLLMNTIWGLFPKGLADIIIAISPFDGYSSFVFGIFDIRQIIIYALSSVLFILLTLLNEDRQAKEDEVRA